MEPFCFASVGRRGLVVGLLALTAWGMVAPLRADPADDRFTVAAGHYSQGRWKLAIEEFQTFLEEYPNHTKANRAIFFLAEAFLQAGQNDEAGTHFRQYLNRKPDGKFARAALFRAGETAYLADQTDLAKAELLRFHSDHPDDKLNAYVLPYLGDIALGEEDLAAAIRYFRDGLTKFPQGKLREDCRFGMARALEKQGENEQAERLYREVSAKRGHPLADDALFHLGALRYAMGEHEKALDAFAPFETVLRDSTWRPNARLGQGWALLKLDRLDEAEAIFTGLVSDAKVGVDARYWLGIVQRMQGDWQAAADSLLQAAKDDPQHPQILSIRFHAADALRQAGQDAAAAEQFDLVIAAATDDNVWLDDALHGKILMAAEAEDHEALELLAAEFGQQFPESSLSGDIARLRAQSLLKQNKHAEATALLEPLAAAGTADEQALADRFLLTQAYQAAERYDDALAVLLPVLGTSDLRLKSDAQLTHGLLLVSMQRYGEAIEPLEAFLGTNPTESKRVQGRGQLAVCYARAEQLDRAKQIYADILENPPESGLLALITDQLAEAAYDAEDPQWAASLFRRLQTEGGSQQYEFKGLAGTGWSQKKAGQLNEAADTFEKLLAMNPPPEMAAEAALARGKILEQFDPPDQALTMYDMVIEKYADSSQRPEALLAAARLRDKLQRDQEAAAAYERLAGDYPTRANLDTVLYEWAWVLDELDQKAESSKLFARIQQQHPKSRYWADATYRLAREAFEQNDSEGAKQLVAQVLAAGAKTEIREHAISLQGQIAVAGEDWKQVAEFFSQLILEFPESPNRLVAEFWIAEGAYRQRDFEEANRRFEQLARQSQGREEPWLANIALRRAQTAAQRKQWDQALTMATKIGTEYPDFDQLHEADYVIGQCLGAKADFQAAREAYGRVTRSATGAKTETAAMAQLMIAESFFHQKNFEAALREYLQLEILYAYPYWQAMALLEAGKCHENLGEWEEATQIYSRLVEAYRETPFAERAKRRLQTTLKEQPSSE